MALSKPGSSSQVVSGNVQTEFDILQASHRFIRHRTNDEMSEGDQLWGERLAENYYSSLYREYAVCDLKHYKSGNFALRWRTESEVISGEGRMIVLILDIVHLLHSKRHKSNSSGADIAVVAPAGHFSNFVSCNGLQGII
ncbi:Protein FRA10AC1 [Grifola frondosa]|uniref:Protein FRA10AC1 n=1 Tax=Grifola frondosa TaxID=5627 RepID=A0A1C7M643_GRIFR|nr:Protein FRA10AC1 [Grifola frondosa]